MVRFVVVSLGKSTWLISILRAASAAALSSVVMFLLVNTGAIRCVEPGHDD